MAKSAAASDDRNALPQERQQRILARLRNEGRVVAVELAEAFAVSEDSIRRDLRELAAQGLCKRVYGGALLPAVTLASLKQRRTEHPLRKQALARQAASLVKAGQTLLIDAGTTNLAIAAALPAGAGLCVITNAPQIAQLLLDREDFDVQMIGGRINPSIGGAIGAQAVEQVRRLRADLCFPGACAIDAAHGLWGFDSEEALFKRAMIEASDETVVVATDDKLAAVATYQVVELARVQHLVVEHSADRATRAAFSTHGVMVHRAEAVA
ncbi:DeoR/GlpR family DNA-binding transcription regulator [Dyella acidiphila]|uniref:DeoR/GlpR transcriptional regulator n=1 Tax=Dyella acidiphila TaxID=2775866 RepID=A0ABR9GEU0_9GAMM|nr:DeoR/GlpR family DNA-binding transcription regulator [Dyella acidiphila]MBE1162572.1 DeoR/GlpR transcriptional regulator [Dyella acidiphila]